MLFNHLRCSKILRVGIRVANSPDGGLRCVTWNTRGLVGSVLSLQRNRELKLNNFGTLIEKNNVICLQEVHGKDEFLQAIQVWARDSDYLVRSFLTIRMQEDQLYASIRIFCLRMLL